jgi:hypothetical protein
MIAGTFRSAQPPVEGGSAAGRVILFNGTTNYTRTGGLDT